MSTVQDILYAVGFQIDDPASDKLYALINLAIRAISKRLYLKESDLITDDLSIDFFAEDTLSANDIAFVDSDPDTITSAVGSVEVFNVGQYLTVTGDSDNNGTYQISKTTAPADANAVTPFDGTITLESDESLTAEIAGDDVILTSLASYMDLPSDFWGLVPDRETGYPELYISGQQSRLLKPSTGVSLEMQHTSAGTPLWFRIKNTKLHLFPPTSTDITIVGSYFKMPTKITATTDTVPYGEMFDDAISQVLLKWYAGPLDQNAMAALQTYLWLEVDKIIGARDMRGIKTFPDGVNWDDI